MEPVLSEEVWHWGKMALDLRTSQTLPLLLLRTYRFPYVGSKTTYCSLWPVYALTMDLFLENPFPVAGCLTLYLVG